MDLEQEIYYVYDRWPHNGSMGYHLITLLLQTQKVYMMVGGINPAGWTGL